MSRTVRLTRLLVPHFECVRVGQMPVVHAHIINHAPKWITGEVAGYAGGDAHGTGALGIRCEVAFLFAVKKHGQRRRRKRQTYEYVVPLPHRGESRQHE